MNEYLVNKYFTIRRRPSEAQARSTAHRVTPQSAQAPGARQPAQGKAHGPRACPLFGAEDEAA